MGIEPGRWQNRKVVDEAVATPEARLNRLRKKEREVARHDERGGVLAALCRAERSLRRDRGLQRGLELMLVAMIASCILTTLAVLQSQGAVADAMPE